MPLKTILWGGFFAATCLGALWSPIWGIIGYVGTYSTGAQRQWWEAPLSPLGIRYYFTLAVFTAVGIALNWSRLRFGKSLLHRHEKLLLLFLGIVWLGALLGPETVGAYTQPGIDHPSVKLTKILIFALMLTHVVTDLRKLDWLLWALVVGALILGLQAYSTPYRAFSGGRLEGIGGSDFRDANMFAGYMTGVLFLIGAQFLRSGRWGKVVCFLAGGFTANAIVLTRSRAAFVGLAAGALTAVLLAPKNYRRKILFGLLVAGIGGLYLSDPQFLNRMSTINASEEERDTSAQSRIVLAKAGARMVIDHPLGVGPGNWFQNVGRYVPERAGKDAHNTVVRCAGELGVPGLAVFLAIVVSGVLLLRKGMKDCRDLPQEKSFLLASYGMMTGLVAVFFYGLTHSLTYVEYLWWFLAMPVCVARIVENLREDERRGAPAIEYESMEPEPLEVSV